MPSKGVEAFKRQAKEASERRSSGFASIILLKAGESVVGRFRGLISMPAQRLTDEQVRGLTPDWLTYFASTLGIPTYDKTEEWVAAFKRRYEQQEPFRYEQHYIARNKGRDAYMTCATNWKEGLPCASCYLRDNGDKGISLRTNNLFTFHPRRFFHKVEKGKNQKADFIWCTTPEGENCRYCAAGHQPKQDYPRYFSFADMHTEGVVACAERVAKRCASCGLGMIKNTGWACSNPECGEPLVNYRRPPDPKPEGYDPRATCPECKKRLEPEEILKCSKDCEAPRRCQLHDVDILVQRMGDKKQTTYAFTEQWPAEPLPDEMLKMNLPNYMLSMAPKEINAQCRTVGLTQNPFTGGAVAAPPQEQTESYEEGGGDGAPVGDPYAEGGEAAVDGEPPADGEDIPF